MSDPLIKLNTLTIIKNLRRDLTKWESAYYDGHPLVSDETYDAKLKELQALEKLHPELIASDSPTTRVGKVQNQQFEKTKHQAPMLSLDNAFNFAELKHFYETVLKSVGQPLQFICEPKVDGSSISLIYQNNQLVQAISRGDGQVGENITKNVQAIKNLKTFIPNGLKNFTIRGEIYMTKSDFETYNQKLVSDWQIYQQNWKIYEQLISSTKTLSNLIDQLNHTILQAVQLAHSTFKQLVKEIPNCIQTNFRKYLTNLQAVLTTMQTAWQSYLNAFSQANNQLQILKQSNNLVQTKLLSEWNQFYTQFAYQFQSFMSSYEADYNLVNQAFLSSNHEVEIKKLNLIKAWSNLAKPNAPLRLKTVKKPVANPRNLVAGTLRLIDANEVAARPLKIVFYQIVYANEALDLPTQAAVHATLKAWGLPTLPTNLIKVVDDLASMKVYLDYFGGLKNDLDFPCDGAVIKVNQLDLHEAIGFTTKFPKWAIAYKFPANIKTTKLLNIEATTGRTGKITYVAKLDPIHLDGTTVESATLHNATYILSKDIRINDYVTVYKAGEIIPKIIAADLSQRTSACIPWNPWTHCSTCDSKLVNYASEVDQYCTNFHCFAQTLGRINHWCARNVMQIDGLSTKIIAKFYKLNLLNDVSDLYTLKKHADLIINGGLKIKHKLFEKLMKAIEASKNNSLERIIFGLGIDNVGAKIATILAKHFLTMAELKNADWAGLAKLEEIGPKIISSLHAWFTNPINCELLQKLEAVGINLTYKSSSTKVVSSFLHNKKVVLTGTFFLPRHELAKILSEQFLCQIQANITAKTDYLIAGEKPGSKWEKAQEHQIAIINNEQIKELINKHA